MRFFTTCISALVVLSSAVFAQENPIIFPGQGATLNAGQTYTITWKPTTSANGITLALRYGESRNLVASSVIAVGVENNGAASWTVPIGIGNGQWAIQIVDSSGNVNYSPVFTISGGTGSQGAAAVTSTLVASTATFTPIITGAVPTSSGYVYQPATFITTTVKGTLTTITKLPGQTGAPNAAGTLAGAGAMLGAAAAGAVALLV